MKRYFIFAAMLAVALTSCKKEPSVTPNIPNVPAAEDVLINVGIFGQDANTKALSTEVDEELINNIQVFVFNPSAANAIDGYGKVVNSDPATFEPKLQIACTAGEREIYALVNADDCSTVATKEQFLALVSELKEDVDNFEMIGNKTETLSSTNYEIPIAVDRFASRVVVKKVTNALSSAALSNQTFALKSMHLTNVAANINYGRTVEPTLWYNQLSYQSANNLGIMTHNAVDSNVAHEASYETVHYFYAYPNAHDHSVETTWSARRSMLVLKVQIGETLYNYPILLPVMEYNKSYQIDEIQITRPGNVDDGLEGGLDELQPVVGQDCVFTISVNDWTTVNVNQGVII